MLTHNYRKRLLQVISRNCAVKPKKLNPSTLLTDLTIDSLSFVSLMVDIEDEFGLEIDDEELIINNYRTVDSICVLVESKINIGKVNNEKQKTVKEQ